MTLSVADARRIAASPTAPLAARQAAFLDLKTARGQPVNLDRLCPRPILATPDLRPPRCRATDAAAIRRVIATLRARFAAATAPFGGDAA